MSEKFSTARAAQILDISTKTIIRWYKWYNSKYYEKPVGLVLPEPEIDNRGTMLFTLAQVQELQRFSKLLKTEYRGCMAEFNAVYQWGKRGTQILQLGKQYNNKKKGETLNK